MDDATLQASLDAFSKALNLLYANQQKLFDLVAHLTPGVSSGIDLGAAFGGKTSPIPTVPAPTRWVPTFERDHVRLLMGQIPMPVPEYLCATQETATTLVALLQSEGAAGIYDQTETGDTDKDGNPKARKLIRFEEAEPKLTWYVNAGYLAQQWIQNPDDLFPGTALRHAQTMVAAAKQDEAAQHKDL